MARKIPVSDPQYAIDRYLSGQSENLLAKELGVGRSVLKKFLIDSGVPRRGLQESQVTRYERTSDEAKKAITAAANVARRGMEATEPELIARAIGVQASARTSANERQMADWLSEFGVVTVPQFAIGPYNTDLAASPVAVEIYGGQWHSSGRHAERSERRFRYILDAGWNVCIVWIVPRLFPYTRNSAEYVAAFVEQSRRDPTLRGEYRVIWSDGKDCTTGYSDVNDLARMPSTKRPR